MALNTEDIEQIRSLINAEVANSPARSRVFDRYPEESDGFEGEMRISQDKYGVTTFSCFANKRWHHVELGP